MPNRLLTLKNGLIIAAFSLVYFADICLRASEKYFWFDEIGTVNISRLPNMHDVWETVLHGMDYNPPLFWLLTRLAGAPFGYGLISTRMPEMIGFWVACVCLFAIAARRFGSVFGVIAMLFPLITGAKYYAYEARPSGLVLGFAGLAALAWQRSGESRYRIFWLLVLCASLTAADLTHAYAVTLCIPFGLAEMYHTLRTRSVRWGVVCSVGVSALLAAPFLFVIVSAYRKVVAGSAVDFFPPTFSSPLHFFQVLLDPFVLAALFCVSLIAVSRPIAGKGSGLISGKASELSKDDLALALSFLTLPIFALAIAVVTKGPFLDRYFLSTVIGVALLVVFGVKAVDGPDWLPLSVVAVLVCSCIADTGRPIKHHSDGIGEVLVEPSSLQRLSTTPGNPMGVHDALLPAESSRLPIIVASGLEYAFLFEYASPDLRSRLWYMSGDRSDLIGSILQLESHWCRVKYNLDSPHKFLKCDRKALLYGQPWEVLALVQAHKDLRIKSIVSRSASNYTEHALLEVDGGMGR